ncbi:C6 zinc finger domain-containing protein [Pleurostoma richardsiae]|uniref:C6 zinc finger domain-containing protein n=1 Tax=Pleurostoma richardsiae TaxID=41990 RepID=A0AA38RY05_9PEZI|nr:C6 zinc finger domain-containing protein [Pleurostoma richardsiae]
MFAPAATVDHLLDEWFKQIHSVAPILHRRRFMHRLRRGDADHDRIFCGLVVSVCAATVATLRRSNYEPVTIEFCAEFVERHQLLYRGVMEADYSLDWCVAMYNLGNAMGSISGMDDLRAYHMGSQSAAGVRYLAYYSMTSLTIPEQQLLKRLFWLLFAWSCSSDLFGRISVALVMCEDNFNHMRPLPLTDEQLDPQAYNLPGLLSLSDLFMVWYDSRRGSPPTSDQASREVLLKHLTTIQRIIDLLPPELRWRGGLSRPANVTQGHDVQIANIFITSLHLRSNLLQKFGPAERCGDEHQRLVDDLLEILDHMPEAIFEANGSSIVPKVRDIGAAYLEQVRIGHNNGVWVSDTAKGKLERLLRKLDDLDFWPSMSVREQGATESPNSLG